MTEYTITYDCDHCGEEIKNNFLHMNKEIEVPISFMGQQSFDCQGCGASFATGDIDVIEMNGPQWEPEEELGE